MRDAAIYGKLENWLADRELAKRGDPTLVELVAACERYSQVPVTPVGNADLETKFANLQREMEELKKQMPASYVHPNGRPNAVHNSESAHPAPKKESK